MISKTEFESNIAALKSTTKENAKRSLEKKIDATIRSHTADIVARCSRGDLDPTPGVHITVYLLSCDVKTLECLGGDIGELVGLYRDAGWVMLREGQFLDQIPSTRDHSLDIRISDSAGP